MFFEARKIYEKEVVTCCQVQSVFLFLTWGSLLCICVWGVYNAVQLTLQTPEFQECKRGQSRGVLSEEMVPRFKPKLALGGARR